MALAARLNKQHHTIYCVSSDGEHDEGSTWEAVNAANKYRINNLINIIDRNNIQISGHTHQVWPLESLKEKYRSFHWHVLEIDGHDIDDIVGAYKQASNTKGRPTMIIAKTVKGKGVPRLETDSLSHIKNLKAEEIDLLLAERR